MQAHEARVKPAKPVTFAIGENLIHIICKQCGTVVRSYVQNPEKYESLCKSKKPNYNTDGKDSKENYVPVKSEEEEENGL